MGNCKCGCGDQVNGPDFLPGHDQKLRTRLEHQVGGLLALQELVNAAEQFACGKMGMKEFENLFGRMFAAKNRASRA